MSYVKAWDGFECLYFLRKTRVLAHNSLKIHFPLNQSWLGQCSHDCFCLAVGITREFKQLVRLRLRGRRKTKGLIKEDNSLHVNIHQTDQLATVECEITT